MKTEQRFHVLGLTPREQLALRGMLFNAFAGWIEKTITEADLYTKEKLKEKSAYTYKLFCRYNNIIELLATEDNLAKAKPTCLIIANETMKLIIVSVNGFDEKQNLVGSLKIDQIKNYYSKLKEKVEQSSQYSYTKQEIEKVKRDL